MPSVAYKVLRAAGVDRDLDLIFDFLVATAEGFGEPAASAFTLAEKRLADIERSMADMKDKFGGTQQAHQAALLVARSLADKGQIPQAKTWLGWVAEQAAVPALRDIARIRLAALQWDTGSVDEALKTLQADFAPETAPLAADLRGDLLMAKGQQSEAVAAYQKAQQGLGEASEYRRVVQAKLAVLGIDAAAANGARP